MGGVFSRPSAPAVQAVVKAAEPAPAPKAAEPVKATSEETKVAANTRARRRMGTRLLFSQERSAGLGTQQTTLGGGAGPGQNTLS
jgi:hypothetical protein